MLYMIQVTDLTPQKHAINISTLTTVLEKLQLRSAEAAARIAKVVFVYVVSDTHLAASIGGIVVKDAEGKSLSWADASASRLAEGIAAEAYIVRAKTTPQCQ